MICSNISLRDASMAAVVIALSAVDISRIIEVRRSLLCVLMDSVNRKGEAREVLSTATMAPTGCVSDAMLRNESICQGLLALKRSMNRNKKT